MCNLINTHTHTHTHTHTQNPGKCGNEESYGKIQGSVGEGRHSVCRLPKGGARKHDGGPSVEGDFRQEPGIA